MDLRISYKPPAPDECVVGTGTGKLYKFKDHVLQQVYNAHTGAVTCCYTTRTGIVTGGRDGTVKLWSFGLDMQVRAVVLLLFCCCPTPAPSHAHRTPRHRAIAPSTSLRSAICIACEASRH